MILDVNRLIFICELEVDIDVKPAEVTLCDTVSRFVTHKNEIKYEWRALSSDGMSHFWLVKLKGRPN